MRLISYNIHKGIGGRDRLYRLQRVIDVLCSQNPDIVLLQEVDRNVRRSGFDDQPALLAEALGFAPGAYQFNHRVGTGGYGNLVIARWPMAKRHNISLRMKGRKNRRAQIVVVETPDGPLRLVNWHLGLSERERQVQVQRLLGHVRYNEYSGLPTLLVGDTNDWRNTLHTGAFAGQGLFQITAPPSRFRTFPAYMPVGALDKGFHCGRIRIEQARVVKTPLARRASDHLPLLIEAAID